MEDNSKVLDAIKFLKSKISTTKSEKVKGEFINCLAHLQKHKIIFYDNRAGEEKLLFAKKNYAVVLIKSEYDTYHVRFRHPVIADKTYRSGYNVRQSLLTTDETEARDMLVEMETLVHNDYWWDINKRDEASKTFKGRVVQIFYGRMK